MKSVFLMMLGVTSVVCAGQGYQDSNPYPAAPAAQMPAGQPAGQMTGVNRDKIAKKVEKKAAKKAAKVEKKAAKVAAKNPNHPMHSQMPQQPMAQQPAAQDPNMMYSGY